MLCYRLACYTKKVDAKAIEQHGVWMNSTRARESLWTRSEYRGSLLNYIEKVYGQDQERAHSIPNQYELERAIIPELDQLYLLIEQFEKRKGLFSLYDYIYLDVFVEYFFLQIPKNHCKNGKPIIVHRKG